MKSASELIHPSGFGYNLINEPVSTPDKPDDLCQSDTILNQDCPLSPSTSITPLSPSPSPSRFPSSFQSGCSPLSIPSEGETQLQLELDLSPTKRTYANILKTGSSFTENIPRKVFGDNPSTGFGIKKILSRSPNQRPPKLVRKGRVDEEVHNPAIISPVFFGKKSNLQKPRGEFLFDETLVVWQRR